MKLGAIICEFNPFHNGHRYIIREMHKKCEYVICIMSGNFTQRSEPALYDKYIRAEAALEGGADLVVSLPFPWSCSSAEYFAAAGVHIAKSLGAESLWFGINSNYAKLSQTAEYMKTREYASSMAKLMKESENATLGAAVVNEKLLASLGLHAPNGPNDILAVEYARVADDSIELCPVKRLIKSERINSAGDIREMIMRGDTETARRFMPDSSANIYSGVRHADAEILADIERLYFRLADIDPSGIEAASGGVGARIVKYAKQSGSGKEMYTLSATKKYTDSRLRRAGLYMMADVPRGIFRTLPQFTEILAANKKGLAVLATVKAQAKIKMLSKPIAFREFDGAAKAQYHLTERADRIYTMCGINEADEGYYMRRTPVIKYI